MKQVKHKRTGQVYGWNRSMAASGDYDVIEVPSKKPKKTRKPAPASTVAAVNADLGQLDELHDT